MNSQNKMHHYDDMVMLTCGDGNKSNTEYLINFGLACLNCVIISNLCIHSYPGQ